MNINMAGFRRFSKIFVFVLWKKVDSALGGLTGVSLCHTSIRKASKSFADKI